MDRPGTVVTFADAAAGGAALDAALRLSHPALRAVGVVAVGECSRSVAAAVADTLGPGVDGVVVAHPSVDAGDVEMVDADLAVRSDGVVVVVSVGVETGQAALLVGRALRARGASSLVLATPVCPRQAEPELGTVFDGITAVERPLARRSLAWHYADWPPKGGDLAPGSID